VAIYGSFGEFGASLEDIAMKILNIAFYRFVELTHLPELRQSIREECLRLQLKGTVLLSSEGMNSCLAGNPENIREFQRFLALNPLFSDLEYKESYSEVIPFKRLLVKLKKEIIPVGDSEIQPVRQPMARLSPKELKAWLDEDREFALLDTRNDYEVQWGSFKKATHLKIQNFRQFSNKINELPEADKHHPLVMFCTGGIRCEKAAIIAERSGFKEVYQLDGGILRYFEECGGAHYEGECFVFDERVALDPKLTATERKSEDGSNPILLNSRCREIGILGLDEEGFSKKPEFTHRK